MMLNPGKQSLFTELTAEQSASVSGGGTPVVADFDLNTYIFIVGSGFLFGNAGLTPAEMHYAWKKSIAVSPSRTPACDLPPCGTGGGLMEVGSAGSISVC